MYQVVVDGKIANLRLLQELAASLSRTPVHRVPEVDYTHKFSNAQEAAVSAIRTGRKVSLIEVSHPISFGTEVTPTHSFRRLRRWNVISPEKKADTDAAS